MAKRQRGSGSALGKSAEARIEGFAEDLGNMLGTARAKAENWMGQRQTIVKSLTELRDTASKLLTDLGHQAERMARRGRLAGSRTLGVVKRGPGRPAGSGKKKKRKMSAAARKAISDAQKKRWAAQKAAAKSK
jgi:ribosomal protein S5